MFGGGAILLAVPVFLVFAVSVSHEFDLSPEMVRRWYALVHAGWLVPIVWSVALWLSAVEERKKKRKKFLIAFGASPFLAAVTYGVAWAIFISVLRQ